MLKDQRILSPDSLSEKGLSKSFIEIGIGEPRQKDIRRLVEMYLASVYHLEEGEYSNLEFTLSLFLEELLELGYYFDAVEFYLKKWKKNSKKWGNDLAALKRLSFNDIFPDKPVLMYSRSWYQNEWNKALKAGQNSKLDELQSMYRFWKDNNIYYSYHDLKPPAGFLDYKTGFELEQSRHKLALEASNQLILPNKTETSEEKESDAIMRLAQENLGLKMKIDELEKQKSELRISRQFDNKRNQKLIDEYALALAYKHEKAVYYARETRHHRNSKRLVMAKGEVGLWK